MRDAARRLETSSALSLAQMEVAAELCDLRDDCTAQSRRSTGFAFASVLRAASSLAQALRLFFFFFRSVGRHRSYALGGLNSTSRGSVTDEHSLAQCSTQARILRKRFSSPIASRYTAEKTLQSSVRARGCTASLGRALRECTRF